MPKLTLPEVLRRAATKYPDLGIGYVKEDGTIEYQTYAELLSRSSRIANGLLDLGLKPGDQAIIATDDNHKTINLLWGCFLAGIVPTILQSPGIYSDHNPVSAKFLNVFKQLAHPYIFVNTLIKEADPVFAENILHYDSIPQLEGSLNFAPALEDLAFIQFSSGSTGDPKGIMLTHRNFAINIEAIILGLELTPLDYTGNWMPLYHDMGLIGYHLTPLYVACQQAHIHTIDFIKNPSLWLDLMSNSKITVTGCPNFGQALVLRYLKRKSGEQSWDFTPMKALLNGAEPISVKIMEDFTKAMKKYNFHDEAMMPVYGMAEATLAITFSPLMKPTIVTAFEAEELDFRKRAVKINEATQGIASRILSGVGQALKQIDIRIVDEFDSEIPAGNIGMIQIKGASVTQGYYNNREETRNIFCGEWLRTGDIGFFFENNLYISGRFKDIIFFNGKNYFANDLEYLACTLEDITYGKVIFGGISDPKTGKEKVLVFLAGATETNSLESFQKLRTLMRRTLGIQIDEMVIIRSNEIPKTTSGKVQRYKLIQHYLHGDFTQKTFK